METIKKITKEELLESIAGEIDRGIREKGAEAERISKIAEGLKNEGKFNAGTDLNLEALRVYRQELINREFERRKNDL